MIHIVTAQNRSLYDDAFAQVAARVGADPLRALGLETDETTAHVLGLDTNGAPEFLARLRPAEDRSLLADHLPDLFANGADQVRRPGVWERLRVFAAPYLATPEEGARRRLTELALAVLEEAHARGAERLVQLTQAHLLAALWLSGPNVRILGLPQPVGGVSTTAVEVECTAEVIADYRERNALSPSRRLHLKSGEAAWAADPKEIEAFLEAARRLPPESLRTLLSVLRAALADEDES